jgi:hypothetical protein
MPIMKTQGVWSGLILAGMGFVFISWFWPSIVGGRQNWSDAQAKEYTETLVEYHRLNGEFAQVQQQLKQTGPSNPQAGLADSRLANSAATGEPVDPAVATVDRLATELAASKARYQKQLAALDQARTHGEGAATVIRWVGIALAAVGIIGMLARRSQDVNC